jgi:hypothetical protein
MKALALVFPSELFELYGEARSSLECFFDCVQANPLFDCNGLSLSDPGGFPVAIERQSPR